MDAPYVSMFDSEVVQIEHIKLLFDMLVCSSVYIFSCLWTAFLKQYFYFCNGSSVLQEETNSYQSHQVSIDMV